MPGLLAYSDKLKQISEVAKYEKDKIKLTKYEEELDIIWGCLVDAFCSYCTKEDFFMPQCEELADKIGVLCFWMEEHMEDEEEPDISEYYKWYADVLCELSEAIFSEDERVKAGIAVLSATLLSMQGKHVREYYLSPDALQNRKETIDLQKLLGL